MNLTELNNAALALWPKCDWTPEEWGLLAETVKHVPADEGEAMLREVRRTQRPGRNPDMQDITRRVRSRGAATASRTSVNQSGASKWEAQRRAWGMPNLTDYETFLRHWQWMRSKHQGPPESFARLWHGYCAIDAREVGMCWNDSEQEAAELTGGTPRPMPVPRGDADDLMDMLVNTMTPAGQPRVDVAGRRRQLRKMSVISQLNDIHGSGRTTP